MKKFANVLLLVAGVSLTSCQKMKSENAFFTLMSEEEHLQQIDAKEVEHLIQNEFSFCLLMYTENCSYCEKALESSEAIQNMIGCCVYTVEMDQPTISYLSSSMPSLFCVNDTYPMMYLINEGKISYKIDYEPLKNYKSLQRVLYPQIYPSDIFQIQGEQSFNRLLHEGTIALVCTYDSSTHNNISSLVKKVYDYGHRSEDYWAIFIDKNTLNTGLISSFCDLYSIELDETFDYLFTVNKGERKTTVRYLSDDGNQVDQLLNTIL